MTTVWARMLIFKAAENGTLSEAAAKYFDQMIDACRFTTTKNTTEEIKNFNGTDCDCVLGKLGEIKRLHKDGKQTTEFSIERYLQMTTFPNLSKNGQNYYLANVLGEDFVGLDNYIREALINKNLPAEKLAQLQKYLEDTYTACASKDVGRKDIVKNFIKFLTVRLNKLQLQNELTNLTSNSEVAGDGLIVTSYLKTLYTELSRLEAEETDCML